MIGDSHKQRLLKELEKSGNVYLSCLKSNIARSTFYRWKDEDGAFRKAADKAEKRGHENNCDIAEHALMLRVKDKDMGAIKYVLSHTSPRYKQRRISNATIDHRTSGKAGYKQTTLEEFRTTSALQRIKETIDGIRDPEDFTLEDALQANAEIQLIGEAKKAAAEKDKDTPTGSPPIP